MKNSIPHSATVVPPDPPRRSYAHPWVSLSVFLVAALLIGGYIFREQSQALVERLPGLTQSLLTKQVLYFVLVGFAAQIVDGALGMAYGISSTSILLGMGISPALASASVHVSEVFTTGISGLSHLRLGNVNRRLFRSLVLPGVVGAVAGAYVLTNLNEQIIKPFVAVYLLIMGIVVLRKAFRPQPENPSRAWRHIPRLALFGGFLDAVGGGGWGPIVASTLLTKGHLPRFTIGSVNLAEFFVAVAGAGTFVALIGAGNWQIIAGLVIGGSLAAPFAARLARKFSTQTLLVLVGSVVILLSLRTLFLFFW